jgi:hypothetical protein
MTRTNIVAKVLLILGVVTIGVSRVDAADRNPPKPKRLVAPGMHPMWLIIKEDTQCLERTPPWGAPSVEEYSKRLDRNLKALELHPHARLSPDFSACELEDVKATYPDLAKRLRAAIERGQVGLINGTYSQPHLHTFSLEASVRQFDVGLKSILDNFGCRVQTYAMQEPGYNDQTPQILKAFGYRFAHRALSGFPTRQVLVPGEKMAGNELFCDWVGLDGTTIPAMQWYAPVEGGAPDMPETGLNPDCEYITFDAAEERFFAAYKGPRPKIRMYIPWGYIEGNRAEELARCDSAAETAMIQMETMSALLRPAGGWKLSLPDLPSMWKTWMMTQHHDAEWAGGAELRGKSCDWLKEIVAKASQACADMLKAAMPSAGDKPAALLFAIYPKKHRGVATVAWSGNAPAAFHRVEGKDVGVQVMPTGPDKGKLLVPFDFNGAGYETMIGGHAAQPSAPPESVVGNWRFENKHYSAEFLRDGSIKSLRTSQGVPILDGNRTAGIISEGGKPNRFDATVTSAQRWKGTVADVFEAAGNFGEVPVVRRLILYHDLPWFEMEIQCEFKNTTIGNFYLDPTKLVYQWPVEPNTTLTHGIGGGSIAPDEPATVIYPVNWLDLGRGAGGLTMINFGTTKHVLKDGTLYAVLAWGGKTAHFGNRVDNPNADVFRALDLRLNGKHRLRFAFYPHDKDWRAAGVPDVAMSLLRPPVAVARLCPADAKPTAKTLLAIDGNLIPTSVFAEGNRLVCRVYEPYGKKPEFSLDYLGKPMAPRLCDVANKPVELLRAWSIANLIVETFPAGPDTK